MKDEEIRKARLKYKELLETYRVYLKLKDRIEELEKDSLVQEYLTLRGMIEKFKIEDNIELAAFDEIANNTKDINEVVVYGGIKHRWLNNPCFIYKGLDSQDNYEIELSKYEDFEHSKDVIKLPESLFTCVYPEAIGEYYNLRLEYFKELTTKESDESVKNAVKKLKANYYKKGKKVE